ncbi:MAG: PqqD family protein [Bacteroidota bacterium]
MKIKKNIAVSENGFVFDPTTGESYSLNEMGTEFLNMLKSGKTKEKIKKEILLKYDVDEVTFEKSFSDFINMLVNYQLIEDYEEN